MKEKKKNIVIYIVLVIVAIFQALTIYGLIVEINERGKNYENSTADDAKLIQRINKLEEKLNLKYDVYNNTYRERTSED